MFKYDFSHHVSWLYRLIICINLFSCFSHELSFILYGRSRVNADPFVPSNCQQHRSYYHPFQHCQYDPNHFVVTPNTFPVPLPGISTLHHSWKYLQLPTDQPTQTSAHSIDTATATTTITSHIAHFSDPVVFLVTALVLFRRQNCYDRVPTSRTTSCHHQYHQTSVVCSYHWHT